MEKLTVLIISYNTAKLLERCIDSVVGEVDKNNTEIIIVDNASTDGSNNVIQKLKIKSQKFNLKIKIIYNKINLGYSRAVNQGFRESEAEVVLLLNADTALTKGCIKTLLEFEEKNRPALIGPGLINSDGSPQASVFRLPTITGAIKEYWLGERGAYSKYIPNEDKPVMVEAVLGGAMLISKEIIDKVGGFDERYFMYFEDLDFCQHVGRAGYPIYYLPSAKIIHEHGASGKNLAKHDKQWQRMIPSSKIYFGLAKHYLIYLILWIGQKIKVN